MKLHIDIRLIDAISLDDDERFKVTGKKSEYYAREQTVLVDHIVPSSTYTREGRLSTLRLHGQRVLKSGAMSAERDTVELRRDDPQIPSWLNDAVIRLLAALDGMRDVTKVYKQRYGVS
jgi:hypothetical protein